MAAGGQVATTVTLPSHPITKCQHRIPSAPAPPVSPAVTPKGSSSSEGAVGRAQAQGQLQPDQPRHVPAEDTRGCTATHCCPTPLHSSGAAATQNHLNVSNCQKKSPRGCGCPWRSSGERKQSQFQAGCSVCDTSPRVLPKAGDKTF